MLTGLAKEWFSDEQVLFTYRTFSSFLLGYLLLETSAMMLRDPKAGRWLLRRRRHPGERERAGTGRSRRSGPERAEPGPVRRAARGGRGCRQPARADRPADEIDARRFPTVHRLAGGLAMTCGSRSSNQAWL